MSRHKKLSREKMAALVASDIEEGSYVNLGIGMPTLIARALPPGRDIILHSENGILGMGPGNDGALDADLIDASRRHVTLLPGASICDHVTSFAMARGGHLDLTVLGAFQVSASGDLANWDTGAPDAIPGVGGAMDLVAGARRVFVMMEHTARNGAPKIVRECSYPLTGAGVVDRIYTDAAIIDVEPSGLVVRAIVEGMTREALQSITGAELRFASSVAHLPT
jgi:3-oxoadipate CoA-transferase, beta subunit